MPMILATSAVHSWLTRKGLRTFTSLNVRAAECIDPHYFAVLIGCGATTVNAYLAEDSIADRIKRGLIEGTLTEAVERFRDGDRPGPAEDHVEDGHLGDLVLSRRAELRGGRARAARWWRSTSPAWRAGSRASASAGCSGRSSGRMRRGFGAGDSVLPIGGFYKARRTGESHAWEAQAMHMLQSACDARRLQAVEAVFQGDAVAAADQSARPAGLHAEGWRRRRWRRSRASPRSASGS